MKKWADIKKKKKGTCHADMEDPNWGVSKRAPTTIITSFDKDVDCINLADRLIRRKIVPNYIEYLVKWIEEPPR